MNPDYRQILIYSLILSFVFSPAMIFVPIESVEAQTIIYINENGAIDPATAPILNEENFMYTLTGNIKGSIIIKKSGIVVDGAGYVLEGPGGFENTGIEIMGVDNVTIEDFAINNFFYGIHLASSSGNILSRNEFVANDGAGIWLSDISNDNIVNENEMSDNWYGIEIDSSSDNIVSDNSIVNSYYGIALDWSSDYNFVEKNFIRSNTYGIAIFGSSMNSLSENNLMNNYNGVYLEWATNNEISGNEIILNSEAGIKFNDSSQNEVFLNNLESNNNAIELIAASENSFYYNNFINNTQNVYVPSWQSSYHNNWDDNYPSGGNYWNDYSDTDSYSGPSQDEPGSDGIWDNPYVIDAENQDNYPIVPEFPTFCLTLFLFVCISIFMLYFKGLLKREIRE
jgi:parallel beta-helix repeat protein